MRKEEFRGRIVPPRLGSRMSHCMAALRAAQARRRRRALRTHAIWPALRRPDSAQASASPVSRFSSSSTFWRKCSRPSRSSSGGTWISGADDDPGPGERPRNGKPVPTADPPRPVVAVAHQHQRHAQLRGQVDRAGGQPPPRAAGAVGRDRQVHPPALGQQLRGSPPRRRGSVEPRTKSKPRC